MCNYDDSKKETKTKGGIDMVKKNGVGKKIDVLGIVIVLIMSAVPMVFSSAGISETESRGIESYTVWGTLVDKYGVPVDTAIVVAVNMDSGNSTWVYGENGTYSLDLADINGTISVGDTIKLIASNGICISNYTFVVEGNSSKRVDFVLDPEEPNPPEIGNPHNPFENSSSPEMITPEFKPDLIITELSFSDDIPVQKDIVTLTATVTTTGLFIESFNVTFYLDIKDSEHYIASKTMTPSPLEVTTKVSVIWNTIDVVGYHNIIAVVDVENKIDESNETNNEMTREICVLTVEFLINESINQINGLKNQVNNLLTKPSDANRINQHLEHAIDWLNDALEEYNKSDIEDAVKDLHYATDELWKAVERTNKLWEQNKVVENDAKDLINGMGDVTYLVIETGAFVLNTYKADKIAGVESMIVYMRIRFLFEKLSHDCDKVDNKLANALHHYQKAMEALAENKDYSQEIEHGYDKLLKAKEDVTDLVKKGKITSEFRSWISEQIDNAIILFPPDLSVTFYDISVGQLLFEGQKASLTITIKNTGVVFARNVRVDVYQESNTILVASYTIPKLDAGDEDTRTVEWTPTDYGTHDIRVLLDAENTVIETNKENNVVSTGFYVLSATRQTVIWDGGHTVPSGVMETYEDLQIIMMNGDLVIESTGHLIFRNVSFTVFIPPEGYDGQYSINVEQDGRFDVLNNSLITPSYQNQRYKFLCYGELNIKQKSTVQYVWGDSTSSTLPGGIQLFSTSDCTIDNSTVWRSKTHNVYCDAGCLRIINNSVISFAGTGENIGNGIYCINGASPIIENCNVTDSKRNGIYLENVIDPSGKPDYVSGGELGYFIWLADDGWHVNMNSDGTLHHFNGSIEINGYKMSFEWNGTGEYPQTFGNGAKKATFDLWIDGAPAPLDKVFIGFAEAHPKFVPFTLGQVKVTNNIVKNNTIGIESHKSAINIQHNHLEDNNDTAILVIDSKGMITNNTINIMEGEVRNGVWSEGFEGTIRDNFAVGIRTGIYAGPSIKPIKGGNNKYAVVLGSANYFGGPATDGIPAQALHAYYVLRDNLSYNDSNICFMLYHVNDSWISIYDPDVNDLWGPDGIESTFDDPIIDFEDLEVTKNRFIVELTNLAMNLTEDDELLIYMHNHGGASGRFYFESGGQWECINVSEMNDLLELFNCNVTLIVDACYSGEFIQPLIGNGRTLISSASDCFGWGFIEAGKEWVTEHLPSCLKIGYWEQWYAGSFFSHPFWESLASKNTLQQAFFDAICHEPPYIGWGTVEEIQHPLFFADRYENVTISNNLIYSLGYGLYIANIANSTIINNTILSSWHGLTLLGSNTIVIGNNVTENEIGIECVGSNDSINNNTFSHNKVSVNVRMNAVVTINNNIIRGANIHTGICIVRSGGVVDHNCIENLQTDSFAGIYCKEFNGWIKNNIIYGNGGSAVGIYVEMPINTRICNNRVENLYHGIGLMPTYIPMPAIIPVKIQEKSSPLKDVFYLEDNTITNTTVGIYIYKIELSSVVSSIVGNNTITYAQFGIFMNTVTACVFRIENNTINNCDTGIKLNNVVGIFVRNCMIFHNYYGINIASAQAVLEWNTISLNTYGVNISVSNCAVFNNTIFSNIHGICCTDNSAPIIENNCVVSNVYGIYSEFSSPTISGNDIWDNTEYGVYSIYSNCTIHNNSISSNTYGIYYADSGGGRIRSNTITDHAETVLWDVIITPYSKINFYKSYGWGVYLSNANITVNSNRISENLYGVSAFNSQLVLANNVVTDHNRRYLFTEASRYDPITDRWVTTQIWGYAGTGVYCCNELCPTYEPSIVGNSFADNIMSIRVILSEGTIKNNTFSFKPIMVPSDRDIRYLPVISRAVWCDYCSYISIINNTIDGQHDYGVYIFDTQNLIMFNNTIRQNDYGIYFYNVTASLSYNNITENNIGIYLDHCPSVDFTGYNYVRDNYTWDLYSIASTWTKTDTDDIGNISST